MKKFNLFFLALPIVFMVYACNSSTNEQNTDIPLATDSLTPYDSATTVHDATDTASNPIISFAVKAGAGGRMEVELGNLAQENAQDPRVKNFGAMMVKDHTKANKELMSLTEAKSIRVPSTMPLDVQTHINAIKKLKGADFDKHYMNMMVDDHKDDIKLFEEAAKHSKDPDLKAFASKTLPVLNMHLDSAKAIKGALK